MKYRVCYKCGSRMEKRKSLKPKFFGELYLVCSNFPNCKTFFKLHSKHQSTAMSMSKMKDEVKAKSIAEAKCLVRPMSSLEIKNLKKKMKSIDQENQVNNRDFSKVTFAKRNGTCTHTYIKGYGLGTKEDLQKITRELLEI